LTLAVFEDSRNFRFSFSLSRFLFSLFLKKSVGPSFIFFEDSVLSSFHLFPFLARAHLPLSREPLPFPLRVPSLWWNEVIFPFLYPLFFYLSGYRLGPRPSTCPIGSGVISLSPFSFLLGAFLSIGVPPFSAVYT